MTQAATQALQIVGDELAVTLSEARAALEEYADGSGDSGLLSRCAELLHLSRGVLRLAETYGAGLLAEEMEATCRHLGRIGRRDSADEGVEALTRAMVRLPSYVERIITGGRDIPLVLLPLLNDLRAARGRPLLSESTLLLLNVLPRDASGESLTESAPTSGEDLLEVCREVRPRFQLALLGWIRGDDIEQNLARMADNALRIEHACARPQVRQLWWVLGGVLEALLAGSLESSLSLKRLLGQADREIKRLRTVGEELFAGQPPEDLINNLLYYVARAGSGGERVAAIRSAFNLADLLPGDEQVEQARESLSAPSIKLMKTVAVAIRDDLARVKDVLDIYVRTGMDHAEELSPQVELLRKISDTLGVLGLGEMRERVRARADRLGEIAAGDSDQPDELLMRMAADLLEIEDELDERLLGLIVPTEQPAERVSQQKPDRAEHDYTLAVQVLMRECVVDLQHVKEIVSRTLDGVGDGRSRDQIPGLLRGITAALLIVDQTRAVGTLERIERAIDGTLSTKSRDPGDLEKLADAIVSVEYYLETLQSGRAAPSYMLDNAEHCLADLLSQGEDEVGMPVLDTAGEGQEPEFESTRPLPAAAVTIDDARPVAAVSQELPPVMALTGDQAPDPELLELFIEEAREAIDGILRATPVWVESRGDEQTLKTIRRAFHTLKGSGRMVGAERLGEYSWTVENLLNRVLNGTMDASNLIADYLGRATAALPELLEQLETGTEPASDIELLVRLGRAIVSGDPSAEALLAGGPQPVADVESPAAPAITISDAEPADIEPAAIDPVLLGILSREVAGHIADVRAFVANCRSVPPPYSITADVHRACHTFHGSVTMARVDAAAAVTRPLNRLVRHYYDHDECVDSEFIDALECALDALETVVAHLTAGESGEPETFLEVARLEHLYKQAEAATSAAEARSPVEAQAPVAEEAVESVAPPPEFSVDKKQADVQPEFDAEIAAIFTEEAAELLDSVDEVLRHWTGHQDDREALAELERLLHTLKGGARMAGLVAMGDLSHALETILRRLAEGLQPVDDGVASLLQSSVDALHGMREEIAAGREPVRDRELEARLQQRPSDEQAVAEQILEAEEGAPLIDDDGTEAAGQFAGEEAVGDEEADGQLVPETDIALRAAPALEQLGELARELTRDDDELLAAQEALPGAGARPPETAGPDRREITRVDAGLLQTLLNNAGEISIYQGRLSQQVSLIQFNLEELGQTVIRLREQLRGLEMETEAQIIYRHQAEHRDEEFDPLELDRYSKIQQLSRALAETASDVNSLRDLLQNLTGDTEALLVQQARTATELQDGLMRTRMVPFFQYVPRLNRLVRQAASEAGVQVELNVTGSSGELDRQVLEKMLPPFEHMLRNAVAHGIETREERAELGKPETGNIHIELHREGAEVVIVVADDGRGVDTAAVRAKASELGMLTPASDPDDEEVLQFILRPGFSTADQITQSAGRGVGMDVVANEIAKLGGTLRIDSSLGQGTRFTIRLPFTLAVTQALIVRAGSEIFALPLPTVEGITRLPRTDFEERMRHEKPCIEYGGQEYRFRHLGPFVGLGSSRLPDDDDRVSLILVRAGENSTALISDEMLDSREIVVKPVGPQLSSIRGIAGATILGDGRVVIILDASALVRAAGDAEWPEPPPEQPPEDLPPLAMVVDDSITMRRVSQRLLERNGFRVVTAKDGVEALSLVSDQRPDIMLLDIEMPRMDGYELATHVRNDPETAGIPIIIITSRVSEKHKARAIELGVNDYLGKPYQEQDLLDAVNHQLGIEDTDST